MGRSSTNRERIVIRVLNQTSLLVECRPTDRTVTERTQPPCMMDRYSYSSSLTCPFLFDSKKTLLPPTHDHEQLTTVETLNRRDSGPLQSRIEFTAVCNSTTLVTENQPEVPAENLVTVTTHSAGTSANKEFCQRGDKHRLNLSNSSISNEILD